jgi:hypothetical protein
MQRERWIILKRTFIFYLVLSLFLGGCLKSSLFISGNEKAINAEIYVDGHNFGLMEKRVYVGSVSRDPVVVEREKKEQQRLRIKPGDIFSGAEIKISSGRHEIMIMNKEGDQLKKEINIQGETYITVDFDKMIIQGGE